MQLLAKNKKAQHTFGLPFGMIFAIFLIVVFIVITFIAIKHFLDIGKCSSIGMFYDEFQQKVNEAWASQSSEFKFKIDLPKGIEKICFANLSADITGSQEDYNQIKNYDVYEANIFLIPPEKSCNMPYKFIKHLNITKITSTKNPYCVDVSRDLIIKKGFYDKEVFVK